MTGIEENDNQITPITGLRRTVFRFAASHAKSVFLAGDFNRWSDYATPVQQSADGFWTVALALPQGRYEYKFIVDGQWCHDPAGDGPYDSRENCPANPFGTMNRVIEVVQEFETPDFQLGAIETEVFQRTGVAILP